MAGLRRVKIGFQNPLTGSEDQLAGQIRWTDYRSQEKYDQPTGCYIGVLLDDDQSKNYIDFSQFIQEIQPCA
jgi:hypothetical protein